MCVQLQEIETGKPYGKINPFRATGMLAEEIVYDRNAGGNGTLEIEPKSSTFHDGDLRLELAHEDLWPHGLAVLLVVKGEVKAGKGKWDDGAQAYMVTSRRRCEAYGLDPDDLAAIGARLREEAEAYKAFLNPAD